MSTLSVLIMSRSRVGAVSTSITGFCCWFHLEQNLTQPCRCHLQVSRHLRAAAAQMHGLQRRDPPGAGHGPVLAPGPPGQEDHRGTRRPLAGELDSHPHTREEELSKDVHLGHQQGASCRGKPRTSKENIWFKCICRINIVQDD